MFYNQSLYELDKLCCLLQPYWCCKYKKYLGYII